MAENELEYDLNVSAVETKIDRLLGKMREMQALASGSGGSASSPEVARSGMAPGGSGSAAGVAGTATSQPIGTPAAVASYNQTVSKFPGLSPGAYQSIAAQLGVTFAPVGPASMGAANAVNNVAMTAATLSFSGGMAQGFNPNQLYQGSPSGVALNGQVQGFPAGYDPNRTQSFDVRGTNAVAASAMQDSLSSRNRMYMSGAMVAAATVGAGFNVAAGENVSGHSNSMGWGGVVGGLVGSLAGARFGLPGVIIGGMIGTGIGSYATSGVAKGQEVNSALSPMIGYGGGSLSAANAWAQNVAATIQSPSGGVSAQAVASGYATASAALVQGGIDPFQITGTQRGAAQQGYMPYASMPTRPGTGGMIDRLRVTVGNTIAGFENQRIYQRNQVGLRADGQPETLGESISRRIHFQYPDDAAAKEVMGRIAPVYGSLPETGGNTADVLMQFGALATFQAQQGLGTPRTGLRQLMDTSADIRGAGRLARLGALRARGSGSAVSDALQAQMAAIGSLEGGRDSVAYAESQAGFREAGLSSFSQSRMTDFDTPLARLSGQIAIAQVRPYAPGQVFGLQAQGIHLQLGRAARTQNFLNYRRGTGQLSEEEELSLTGQIAQDQVSAATTLSTIAMGSQNLLPGLAATGAFGAGFRKFTGMQQASTYLNPYAFFRRDAGFSGGSASNRADGWLSGMGVPSMAHSRSEGVNAGGGMGDPRVIALLERIAKALDRGSGSFDRPNRGPGDLNMQTGPRGWGGP